MTDRMDVVVVGAGLAGLQCTRLLAASGLRVLLVDAKAAVDRAVHTTGIFVRRTLEDFALPEDCLGPAVRHVWLHAPSGRAITLQSPHDEFRVGHMGRLYARYLDECRQSGACWAPGTRYLRSSAMSDGTCVHLQTGKRAWAVRTRYLVGADGATSRVARDLDLDENREWIVGVEDVLRGVPLDGPPRFHCFLDPTLAPGYIAWLIHDGEHVHLGVGGYPAHFAPLQALSAFRRRAAKLMDLERAEHVERRGGRIPVGGVLPRIVNRRGLLLGDAAGAVSPLTAGGLDPCMRLGRLAATAISSYLATGVARSLDACSGGRFRRHFAGRLRLRRALGAVRSPLLVEAGCALLHVPGCDRLAARVFFGRGSFPD